MTNEELLKIYLKDPVFIDNEYISEEEVENFDWNDKRKIPIVEALKIIIRESANDTGDRTSVRLVNQYLDNTL